MTAAAGTAALGVDVGGTGIKALLVDGDGTELAEWHRATPHGDTRAEQTAALIADLAARARAVAGVAAVGVVIPGIVDTAAGICRNAVNLGWRDLPVRQILARALGLPVAFGHDVRSGALAEARTGAAAGPDADAGAVAVFLPIGTGVAAAYTRGREILELGPSAGEVGQILLRHGPCTGMRVEQAASAAGIARRLGQPDARAAADLVRAGDPAARAVWDDAVAVLADVIAWSTALLGPRTVVIGGGLSKAGDLLIDPLREAVGKRLGVLDAPRVRTAVHGERAAMIGAVMLAGDLAGTDPYRAGRPAVMP